MRSVRSHVVVVVVVVVWRDRKRSIQPHALKTNMRVIFHFDGVFEVFICSVWVSCSSVYNE